MKKSKGFRSGTRKKLKKNFREKFKVTNFLQEFKPGDKVTIVLNPSSHKGMPFPRFKGKIGEVKEKRGKAFLIEIKDGDKFKKIISRPEHLKPIKS